MTIDSSNPNDLTVTVTLSLADWLQVTASMSHDVARAYDNQRDATARGITRIMERIDSQLPYERV